MARLCHQIHAFADGPVGWLGLGNRRAGTPMVLVHGFAGNVLTWQLNLAALASERPVLALDLPGHGRSTPAVGAGTINALAGWLGRALEALGHPRCHLVGHSLGGWVALAFGLAQPERVQSLALIACGGLSPAFDLEFLRRLLTLSTIEEATDHARRLFGTPPANLEALARALLAAVTDPAARAGLATIVERAFVPGAAAAPPIPWAALPVPVQILWGEADTIIPPPAIDRLPPTAPVYRLDGVGHLPHLEAAGWVNTRLLAFARAHDGSLPCTNVPKA